MHSICAEWDHVTTPLCTGFHFHTTWMRNCFHTSEVLHKHKTKLFVLAIICHIESHRDGILPRLIICQPRWLIVCKCAISVSNLQFHDLWKKFPLAVNKFACVCFVNVQRAFGAWNRCCKSVKSNAEVHLKTRVFEIGFYCVKKN